jgi:C-5 cytosine-specific DNA methylase
MFDEFCGVGGWSIGFYRHGFQCFGIDNVDVGYPYHLFKSDIRQFDGREFQGKVRAVMISPPCTEYSKITVLSAWKGQRPPPDPYGPNGVELVKEGLRVKDEIAPKYWLLENVLTSRKYIEPILGEPKMKVGPYLLWGNFPLGIFSAEPRKQIKGFHAEKAPSGKYVITKGSDGRGLPEDFAFDPLRSWKRARIPVFIAEELAKACSV